MHEIVAKTILSPQNGMNLYRGCTHGCIYCDARSDCYQMHHPFEDVAVKCNAPALLRDALRRKRRPCMIATGSMCDPYLPLEASLQLTRRCLSIIDQYGCGVTVLTKSTLVLRDLDLLSQIAAHTKCVVQMTLTTADDNLCRILEPNVAPTSERLSALRTFHAAGIPTVVWLSPFLPWINDTADNLRALLDGCVAAGVTGIVCFGIGMTLRDGNRAYFYEQLDRHFPHLRERYVATYGQAYEIVSPNAAKLFPMVRETCLAHGILHSVADCFAFLQDFPAPHDTAQLAFDWNSPNV